MIIFIKAFFIGASMLIPGVSGGTMSMILGIYDRLIFSISSFRSHKRENFLFLVKFILGAGTAFLLLSGPMAALVKRYPEETAFFVTGAVIGGIPVIYQEAQIKKPFIRSLIYTFTGLFLVIILNHLPKNLFDAGNTAFFSIILQFLSGILGALALVFPGISFSSMLYMMGVYPILFGALGERNFTVLIPFLGGCIFGILFLTKFLEKAMKMYPHPTYMIILGFVIGSAGDIMKEIHGPLHGIKLFFCFLLAFTGVLFIRILSNWEKQNTAV